jgi:CubicO group peptidase (beta-lactamase class C family)
MKRLFRFLLLTLAVIGIVLLGSLLIGYRSLRQTARNFETPAAIDSFIQQQMAAHQVHGVSIGLVEDGAVRYTQGYSLDPEYPITADSLFQLASVSKPITAWGVMHLVEDNLIELDTPVVTYLSRWTFPDSSFDASAVTVRQLLSHTAGVSLGGYLGFPPDVPLQTLVESLTEAQDTIPLTGVTLITEPGTEWRYSGGGYTVLQLLIEEVTGETFADTMQQNIFTPLGMSNTGYVDELPSELVPVFDTQGNQQPAHRFTALAAAGVYSNAHDMALWLRATVQPTETADVLDADILALMLQTQPASQGHGRAGFGLGYGLNTTFGTGIEIADHDGVNDPGWRSYMAVIPERGAGLALLTNSPGGAELHREAGCAWVTHITQEVTLACLMDSATGMLPVMGVITVVAVVLGVVLWRRRRSR